MSAKKASGHDRIWGTLCYFDFQRVRVRACSVHVSRELYSQRDKVIMRSDGVKEICKFAF